VTADLVGTIVPPDAKKRLMSSSLHAEALSGLRMPVRSSSVATMNSGAWEGCEKRGQLRARLGAPGELWRLKGGRNGSVGKSWRAPIARVEGPAAGRRCQNASCGGQQGGRPRTGASLRSSVPSSHTVLEHQIMKPMRSPGAFAPVLDAPPVGMPRCEAALAVAVVAVLSSRTVPALPLSSRRGACLSDASAAAAAAVFLFDSSRCHNSRRLSERNDCVGWPQVAK
jgi:hypothetical protein